MEGDKIRSMHRFVFGRNKTEVSSRILGSTQMDIIYCESKYSFIKNKLQKNISVKTWLILTTDVSKKKSDEEARITVTKLYYTHLFNYTPVILKNIKVALRTLDIALDLWHVCLS